MATTYTARATRTGDWWAIEVDEVEGVFSQARRLDQVEAMARDAIALMLDVDPDSFDVLVSPELPAQWQEDLDELRCIRTTADTMVAMAGVKAWQTVRLLHDAEGLPMREIGAVLGVSHQRIHQLLSMPMPMLPVDADLFSMFRECVDTDRVEKAKAELGLT